MMRNDYKRRGPTDWLSSNNRLFRSEQLEGPCDPSKVLAHPNIAQSMFYPEAEVCKPGLDISETELVSHTDRALYL